MTLSPPKMYRAHTARWFIAGIIFAILWASASTATKIGLTVAQPLVIAEVRFALASIVMLLLAHIMLKHRLPVKREWKQLALYGLLNISIYLGLYVVAMQYITAGIGALAVASNPVFISFLSVLFFKKRLHFFIVVSIVVCTFGVLCASWPLLGGASVSIDGLIISFFSMLSYSVATIYFSANQWNGLSLLTINGWHTFLGGIFLAPVSIFYYNDSLNQYNGSFWLSVGWLAIPVSILAVQLWLWLLQVHVVRAGLWLFLCPLLGYLIAAWLLKDVISLYTIAGVVLVIVGLLLSNLKEKANEVAVD